MSTPKKFSLFVIVASALLLLLAACGESAAPTPTATASTGGGAGPAATPTPFPTATPRPEAGLPQYGGVYRRAHGSPGSTDPYHVLTNSAYSMSNAFNRLIEHQKPFDWDNPNLLVPALATEWSVDETNTKWTFKLREGVTFHDGELLAADDVKATFDRAIDPDLLVYRWVPALRGVIEGVEVVDDRTVIIDTGRPNALTIPWISNWYAQIMPEHLIVDPNPGPDDSGWRWMQENLDDPDLGKGTGTLGIGTGPYIMTNSDAGDDFTHKRNPNYWDFDQHGNRLPYMDGIIDFYVADRSRYFALFATNNILDLPALMGLSAPKADVLCSRRRDGCHFDKAEHGFFYLMFNDRVPPFDDPEFREAARWSVDMHKSIFVPFAGLVGAAGQWMHFAWPEANISKTELYTLEPWLDPDQRSPLGDDQWTIKAKERLAELGYPDGIDLELPRYMSFTPTFRDMDGSISMDLASAGIRHESLNRTGADAELRAGLWSINRGSCSSVVTAETGAIVMAGVSWSATVAGRPWAWDGVEKADPFYNESTGILDDIKRGEVLKNLERYYAQPEIPFMSEGWTLQFMTIPDCIRNFAFGPVNYGMEQTQTWMEEGYCRRAEDLEKIEPTNLNVVQSVMWNWQ